MMARSRSSKIPTDPVRGDAPSTTIGAQLRRALEDWSAAIDLGPSAAVEAQRLLAVLGAEALELPPALRYPGLSAINANGLPCQWLVSLGPELRPSLRFLVEAGQPGRSVAERCAFSLGRFGEAAASIGAAGAWDRILPLLRRWVLPEIGSWPEHWRSAVWSAAAVTRDGAALKVYLNLNRDDPIARWRRVGWVLRDLGREASLERLCSISGSVSRGSWPVGLAVDLLPGNLVGRLKVYFRSGAVDESWLGRWLALLGDERGEQMLAAAMAAFPRCGPGSHPERAFTVSFESHADDRCSAKVDLALTRWCEAGDGDALPRIAWLAERAGIDPTPLQGALGPTPLAAARSGGEQRLRFLGLGTDPDGSPRVNVYLEPRITIDPAQERARAWRHPATRPSVEGCLRLAARFLSESSSGDRWCDYDLPVGPSDQWVTAWTLFHLRWWLPTAPAALRAKATAARGWLVARGLEQGGWGYHADCPMDADTTALAVLALSDFGGGPRGLLDRCRSHGRWRTYPPETSPRPGWSRPCWEVTPLAAAAHLMVGQDAAHPTADATIEALLDDRSDGRDPCWPSYWWATPLYTAWASAEMVAWLRAAGPATADTGALRNLADRCMAVAERVPAASAFERALRSLLHLRLGRVEAAEEDHQHLLREQRPDGGWAGSAILRLANPDHDDPQHRVDGGPYFADIGGVFTTAIACAAIAAHPERATVDGPRAAIAAGG